MSTSGYTTFSHSGQSKVLVKSNSIRSYFITSADKDGPTGTFVQKIYAILALTLATIAIYLIGIFCSSADVDELYGGGFNISRRVFLYHPFFLTFGMIFCGVNSTITYKLLPSNKKIRKLTHVILHSCSLIFISLGIAAVVYGNNSKAENDGMYYPNLYSLHSFIGIAAIIVYFQNYVLGFIFYFIHAFPLKMKRQYMPNHKLLGFVALIFSFAAVETGVMNLFNIQGCGYEVDSRDTNPIQSYKLLQAGCKTLNGFAITVLLAVMFAFMATVDIKITEYGHHQTVENVEDNSEVKQSESLLP